MSKISKILMAVNEDDLLPNFEHESLLRLLKSLNFKFCKRNRNNILTETSDLIIWRRNYLRSIKQFREERRPIYYLGETWLNIDDCVNKVKFNEIFNRMGFQQEELSTGSSILTIKENKLIILHIGSDDGFLPGGFMYFKTNKNTIDYHDEINDKIFQNWFEEVLPLLKENAIIVMNNVPCHSVKTEKVPNLAWKKHCIVGWLISKGEDFDTSEMVKVDLMKIVQRLKPR
jgi:hypothetical protein